MTAQAPIPARPVSFGAREPSRRRKVQPSRSSAVTAKDRRRAQRTRDVPPVSELEPSVIYETESALLLLQGDVVSMLVSTDRVSIALQDLEAFRELCHRTVPPGHVLIRDDRHPGGVLVRLDAFEQYYRVGSESSSS